MGNQWGIHIDIEGFSKLFRSEEPIILQSLRDLMGAIFDIGVKYYSEHESRIRAHQIVDGFIILIDFAPKSLEVPIAISIALLRHVAAGGRFAKASIGEGDSGDYTSCYPERVLDARKEIPDTGEKIGPVRMGSGLMTLFSVFGTAHIDAYEVHKKSPRGSLLTLNSSKRYLVPQECNVKEIKGRDLLSIDWVNSELPLVSQIQEKAGLSIPTCKEIKDAIIKYTNDPTVVHGWKNLEEWRNNTLQYLNLS